MNCNYLIVGIGIYNAHIFHTKEPNIRAYLS